jgi:hypothetical protein
VDPEQYQDPDNEVGLFSGTTYEEDDEEADKIYEAVDNQLDSRRRVRRSVNDIPLTEVYSLMLTLLEKLVKPKS